MPTKMDPEPSTPKAGLGTADYEWDSESVYSRDNNTEPCASPLRFPSKRDDCTGPSMSEDLVLHGYHAWKYSSSQIENTANPPAFERFHSESSGNKPGPGSPGNRPVMPQKDALYSPLTPFFADKEAPANKKGSKIMFGQNGWLERTGQTPEKTKETQKKSMFEGIKRMARGFVSDLPCSATGSALPRCSTAWESF